MVDVKLKDMGKTRSWLARQIGVAPPQITRIFSGAHKGMRLEHFARLSQVLKIPMEELLNWARVWEGYRDEEP